MIGCCKKIEKIIRENAFEQKNKKPGLKFNTKLPPIGTDGRTPQRAVSRLVPSRYLCVFGVREDWRLGWGARGLMGRYEGKIRRKNSCTFPRDPARLNLIPNLLSPQKHINSDWVRVWAVRSASLRATPLSPPPRYPGSQIRTWIQIYKYIHRLVWERVRGRLRLFYVLE